MMTSSLFEYVVGGRNRLYLAAFLVAFSGFVVGCETADPEVEERPIIFTGTPQGGGPVEETRQHDVANMETALERPAVYTGDTLVGEASVYQLVSPRGFWVESGQERILMVILDEEPGDQIRGLERGDRLNLSGELRTVDNTDGIEGELDGFVRTAMDGEEYYLAVPADAVEVVSGSEEQEEQPVSAK